MGKQNLIGQKFGKLLVVGQAEHYRPPTGRPATQWKCVCDCGSISTVRAGNLKAGTTSSCGCLRIERLKARLLKHGATGTPAHTKWLSVKVRAKRKGLPHALSWEDWTNLDIPASCPVLGIPLTFTMTKDNQPSVDRIDNSEGYTKDNIRIISHRANRLKSDASVEEVERILNYMKGNQ